MNPAQPPSPSRLLESLVDRFGAFEAIANSSIKLARYAPEDELAMDLLVAEAVLEFGSALRYTASSVEESRVQPCGRAASAVASIDPHEPYVGILL